jgi:hypothetical protein
LGWWPWASGSGAASPRAIARDTLQNGLEQLSPVRLAQLFLQSLGDAAGQAAGAVKFEDCLVKDDLLAHAFVFAVD